MFKPLWFWVKKDKSRTGSPFTVQLTALHFQDTRVLREKAGSSCAFVKYGKVASLRCLHGPYSDEVSAATHKFEFTWCEKAITIQCWKETASFTSFYKGIIFSTAVATIIPITHENVMTLNKKEEWNICNNIKAHKSIKEE